MRKSKAETALTRRRIVETAAAQFRQNGIHETGIAEIMAATGLTQGGFYRHFSSKNQLVAEACGVAMDSVVTTVTAAAERGGTDRKALGAIADVYLSMDHRDNRSGGCPLAGLGSELGRASEDTRAGATAGFEHLIEVVAKRFPRATREEARARAVFALSAMIGAVTLSRVVTDARLSEFILQETKEHLVFHTKTVGQTA